VLLFFLFNVIVLVFDMYVSVITDHYCAVFVADFYANYSLKHLTTEFDGCSPTCRESGGPRVPAFVPLSPGSTT